MMNFQNLKEKIRFKIYLPARRLYSMTLDRYYKIDTEEGASLPSVGVPENAGVWYESTPIGEFLTVMKSFHIRSDDVFLDMGSGKGRTLLLAGRSPFKKIIGVDISEKLRKIAETNISRVKQRLACQNYEFVTCNALDYEVPTDVTYVYFFNPFPYEVLNKVLMSLDQSIKKNPRNVTLIYYNPKYTLDMERDYPLIKIKSVEFNHLSLYKSRFNIYAWTC